MQIRACLAEIIELREEKSRKKCKKSVERRKEMRCFSMKKGEKTTREEIGMKTEINTHRNNRRKKTKWRNAG